MLALSDTAVTGFFAIGVAVIGLMGIVLPLLFRSTKAEARQATAGVDELSKQIGSWEERHRACQRGLHWAYGRITALEAEAGLPISPPPEALREFADDT